MAFDNWWYAHWSLFCGSGFETKDTARMAWNKAREIALQECAEICNAMSIYYGTQSEGKEEPVFGHMIAKESAARSCKEAICRRLLVEMIKHKR